MTDLTARAELALTQTLKSLLDGGRVNLYFGASLLVSLPLPTGDEIAVGTGRASRYEAVDAAGTPVLSGPVGGFLLVDPPDIVAGARVTMTEFSVGYGI